MNRDQENKGRERRLMERREVRTAVRVKVWKKDAPERRAEARNLSREGIFFVANWKIAKGETLQILLKMPEEISGEPTTEWRCIGHVTHVEKVDARGNFGIGVQFCSYEVSRFRSLPLLASALVERRVPL